MLLHVRERYWKARMMLRSLFAILLALMAQTAVMAEAAHAGHKQGSANAAAALLAALEAQEAVAKKEAGPPPWEKAMVGSPGGGNAAPAASERRAEGRAGGGISRSLAREVAVGRIGTSAGETYFVAQSTVPPAESGELYVTFLPSPFFLLASTLALTGVWRATRRGGSA